MKKEINIVNPYIFAGILGIFLPLTCSAAQPKQPAKPIAPKKHVATPQKAVKAPSQQIKTAVAPSTPKTTTPPPTSKNSFLLQPNIPQSPNKQHMTTEEQKVEAKISTYYETGKTFLRQLPEQDKKEIADIINNFLQLLEQGRVAIVAAVETLSKNIAQALKDLFTPINNQPLDESIAEIIAYYEVITGEKVPRTPEIETAAFKAHVEKYRKEAQNFVDKFKITSEDKKKLEDIFKQLSTVFKRTKEFVPALAERLKKNSPEIVAKLMTEVNKAQTEEDVILMILGFLQVLTEPIPQTPQTSIDPKPITPTPKSAPIKRRTKS